MSGCKTAPGHISQPCCCRPLICIEGGGTKQIGRRRGIAPFAILKCSHIEVQKHAETQIHEPLLQFEELPSGVGSHVRCFILSSRGSTTKQDRGSRSLCDQLE